MGECTVEPQFVLDESSADITIYVLILGEFVSTRRITTIEQILVDVIALETSSLVINRSIPVKLVAARLQQRNETRPWGYLVRALRCGGEIDFFECAVVRIGSGPQDSIE